MSVLDRDAAFNERGGAFRSSRPPGRRAALKPEPRFDTAHVPGVYPVLRRFASFVEASREAADNPVLEASRKLRDPIQEERDATERFVAEAERVPREAFVTTFTLARAVRTLHMYDVSFWAPKSVAGYVSRSAAPSVRSVDLDEKYNDLKLASYVPPAMLPSDEEFRLASNPRGKEGAVQVFLEKSGVLTAGVRRVPVSSGEDRAAPSLLAQVMPFANRLQSACVGREFFQRPTGAVYTIGGTRPLAR